MSDSTISSITPRVFFDEPVTITAAGGGEPLVGRALNLSRGGIYVRPPALLPKGCRVRRRFNLPDGDPVDL